MEWLQIPASLKRGYARRPIRLAVNLALLLLVVAFFASRVTEDWQAIMKAGLALDLRALVFALLLYGVNYLLFVGAWHRLVFYSGGPTKVRQNTLYYSYSYLARLLPTPLWHHASRIRLYTQAGMRKRSALTITILETVLQISTGVAFYLLITIQSPVSITLILVIFLAAALSFAYRHRWKKLRVMRILREANLGLKVSNLAVLSALYLLTWIIAGPFLHFALSAFSTIPPPSMLDLWRIWTLSSLVAYIGAYTLGGIGILREFTMIWLLSPWYPPPTALIITVGVRLIMILAGLLFPLATVGFLRLSSTPMETLVSKASDPTLTRERR